jgi:hypothetical protein
MLLAVKRTDGYGHPFHCQTGLFLSRNGNSKHVDLQALVAISVVSAPFMELSLIGRERI